MNETENENSTPEAAESSLMQAAMRTFVSNFASILKGEPQLKGYPLAAAQCLRNKVFCHPTTMNEIFDWAKADAALNKTIQRHLPEAAQKYFIDHLGKHSSEIATGESSLEIYSLAEIEKKFAMAVEQCMEQKISNYKAHIDAARIIAGNVAEKVKEKADSFDRGNRAQYAEWGLPASESPLVLHLRKTEKFVRQMVSADASPVGPEFVLPFLAPILK